MVFSIYGYFTKKITILLEKFGYSIIYLKFALLQVF